MIQITWRVNDSLAEQVRAAARGQGLSVNEFLNRLATAAFADDESDPLGARLRNRLRAAGLLAEDGLRPAPVMPPAHPLKEARIAAATGTAVSQLVSEGRG
ncbi:MAG: hypothetical protein LBU05_03870 [Bifidobacteriaceae bacterium]|jgi:hypothetical protein|nr:hypothetical protein [Bifidobacteriaceae bacterium]